MRKKTDEKFIIDGWCVHGDKFNYKFIEYKNNRTKVIIICNTCGYVFKQTPNNHLNGCGCPKCAIKKRKEKLSKTHEQFENKARNIHSDKFEYLTEYVNNKTYMTMKCNICGYVFKQTPGDHLKGCGCSKCAIKNLSLTHEQFENKAKNIHGDKYEYLSEYVNSYTYMTMKCNTCECIFEQTPDNHLRNHGCPHCARKYKEKYAFNNIPVYNTHQPQLQPYGVECRHSPKDKNILEVRCMYCGKWYQPTLRSVRSKIQAIKGQITGEQNLYCSNNCKLTCPTYHQIKYSEDEKDLKRLNTSREVQSQLRKIVLKHDNYTCQRCGTTEKQLHCHHLIGIEINPIESADIDNCITFCIDCHDWIHHQKGCTYNDFKRKECEINE